MPTFKVVLDGIDLSPEQHERISRSVQRSVLQELADVDYAATAEDEAGPIAFSWLSILGTQVSGAIAIQPPASAAVIGGALAALFPGGAPVMSSGSTEPGIRLSLEQRTMLATCLADLIAIHVSRSLSGGLLVRGMADSPLEVTPQVAAAVSRLGEENMSRWRRLRVASPFIVSLADRITDPYLNHGLRVAEAQGAPGIARFRERARAEGGPAAYVRARINRVPDEFGAELDRAIALYRYFESWPDGFRTDGPPDAIGLRADDPVGCAAGIALVAVGAAGFGASVAVEALSVGVATPLVFAGVGASSIAVGLGAAIAAETC